MRWCVRARPATADKARETAHATGHDAPRGVGRTARRATGVGRNGKRRRGVRTVLPSEPVDTTSFYKNVLRLALAAVGLPASRPRDYPACQGELSPLVHSKSA